MNFKVCDMHCDTITCLADNNISFIENNMHISLVKLKKSNYLAQCFAIFVKLNKGQPFNNCNNYIDYFNKLMNENKDYIKQANKYNDIIDNEKNNLLSAILTIEEGGVLEGKLENLDHFYNRGVRMLTLTWNYPNEISYPNIGLNKEDGFKVIFNSETEHGLTDFGINVVKRMNELGMIIDVSHLSDAGFYDVIKYSTKPIVASHSNSRQIQNVCRNLTDDMILKLKENGGVMGINFCKAFISFNDTDQIDDIVQHIKHITSVGGIDICALGSDFDGIETPKGMSDCTKMDILAKALLDNGFTNEDVEKIFYKNFLRVFKANCSK